MYLNRRQRLNEGERPSPCGESRLVHNHQRLRHRRSHDFRGQRVAMISLTAFLGRRRNQHAVHLLVRLSEAAFQGLSGELHLLVA